jgi:hypothetical protein
MHTQSQTNIHTHKHIHIHTCYTRTVPPATLGKLLISGLEEDELVPVVRALDTHGMAQDPGATFEVRAALMCLVPGIVFEDSNTLALLYVHTP